MGGLGLFRGFPWYREQHDVIKTLPALEPGRLSLKMGGFSPQNACWVIQGGWEDSEAILAGCVRPWVKLVFPGIRKNWSYLLIPKGVWDGE